MKVTKKRLNNCQINYKVKSNRLEACGIKIEIAKHKYSFFRKNRKIGRGKRRRLINKNRYC
jgi:hypothetical protein